MRNVLKRTDKYFWFATAIIAAGCAVRLFALGSIPCGLNQDEAFAGYNAWALLHYGVDSSGYHNPVYFTAWGSGMNALESYLMILLRCLAPARPSFGFLRLSWHACP